MINFPFYMLFQILRRSNCAILFIYLAQFFTCIFFLLVALTESYKVLSETDFPEKDFSTTNLQVQEHNLNK